MHEEENIQLAKQGLEAAMRGDYAAVRPLLDDDISYSGPFQPEMHGVDEVIAGMRQWDEHARELGVTLEHEYEGASADENRVVMLLHLKGRRDGRTFDTHEVQVVDIRGGKASRLTEYTSEPEKLAAMMS